MTATEASRRGRAAARAVGGEARAAAGQVADRLPQAAGQVAERLPKAAGQVADRLPQAIDHVAERMPQALELTRDGMATSAATLRTMPDRELRLLAAFSAGLALGLYLAGAPRLVTLAAATPAIVVGAAVLTRAERLDPAA
ncbi:MAG TPA: hypothetical protein VFW92_07810 [Candidatus Limnocylindrales bacterium]|nr:hypothetical protein [Candidatus Limnocylindrales bacterium]